MSYARPSPRPGEIYNRYGPPRPSTGNAYSYPSSAAGAGRVQPSRPPPQQYRTAGPSYRGASSRQGLRSYGDAGFNRSPRQSPSRPPYNNSSSKSSDYTDFDYHQYPSRSRAMTEGRSWNFRKPTSTARPDDARDYQSAHDFNRGLPMRTERSRTAEDHYLDSEVTGQALDNNHDSGEAQGSWSWDKIKKTMWGNTPAGARDQSQSPEDDRVQEDVPTENQNTLWTKLATVGASFQKKIHGEDGYASDASDYQGESHLIRIMKKYYTEKAESAHDLPDWLFSQAELKEAHSRTKGSSLADPHRPERRPGRYEEEEEQTDYRRGDPARSGRGALSDIYDSVDQDRNKHSRNGSTAKQSFDSGYGSSSNTPGRRGRYDDSRSEFTESKPSLGRNRLAINNDRTARYHPGSNLNDARQPMSNIPPYADDRSGRNEPRRLRSTPTRGPPAPSYTTPTVVDYFRPSGQDDRYPIPKPKYQASYAY